MFLLCLPQLPLENQQFERILKPSMTWKSSCDRFLRGHINLAARSIKAFLDTCFEHPKLSGD